MAHIRCRRCGEPVPKNADRCSKCGAPPPVDETLATVTTKTRFKVGDVIDSRYEVVAVLPTGGMGELYKVRHVHLGDFRVVKIRKPSGKSDETGTKRFIREAKLAASIKHQNLASLFDFAQLDDGSFYMVNEYVDGMTIAEHIRAGGRFEIAQALRIAEQALLALEAIHTAGIVHRDVASDNLMLAQSSSDHQTIVKLIDLGIAKTLDGEGLTSTGYFVGKARYASPEQVNTQDPEPIDQRSDLYSLGIVLYEMLSGDVPFSGSTPAASVIKRLTSEVTQIPPRDASIIIDPSTEAIILRLLRRNRDERFPTAADALLEVRRLVAERPNYETEATLSRITRDRELVGGEGASAPPKGSSDSGAKGSAGAKAVLSGTVEMSLEELSMASDEEPPPSDGPPVQAEVIVPTEALPQISRDLRDKLMAPPPPAASQATPSSTPGKSRLSQTGEEPAETMPFQKWQQSQPPTVPTPSTPAPPPAPQSSSAPLRQEEIPTIATGQMKPVAPPPPPAAPPPQPQVVLPPPAQARAAAPPSRPAATPPTPVAAQPPRKGMSRKTLVIIVLVSIFALAAFSLAGYAALELYKRFGAPRTTPSPAAVPSTTDTATTGSSTDTAEVEIIETATAPTATASAITDTAPPTDTTATIATETTATVAPEKPKIPPKTTKKREKAPVAAPVDTTPEPAAPEPEPEPRVSEGDLVAPGPGVVDAKLIAKQPLKLSIKDKLKRTRGTATVAFVVGINGVPENLEIVESSGDDAIDKAALRAAEQSRYSPATKDGVRVRVRETLTFTNEKQSDEPQ